MATNTPPHAAQIDLRGISKRFQHHPVLNQLSLTLNDGDLCILVGDNGAGKTTLLRILAGLVRPSQGEVSMCGSSPIGNPRIRRMTGYVGHQPMVYQDLTPRENLHHYARLYRLEMGEEAVADAIAAFNMAGYQHQPVRTLSRGMQQRLSLARATLHNPAILLLDEPYTGLDQEAAAFLDHSLQRLNRPGRIILLAAHRPQRLLRIASHVAWLREGAISEHLPMAALGGAPELNRYLQEVS